MVLDEEDKGKLDDKRQDGKKKGNDEEKKSERKRVEDELK